MVVVVVRVRAGGPHGSCLLGGSGRGEQSAEQARQTMRTKEEKALMLRHIMVSQIFKYLEKEVAN